jgi:hypothetical protein
MERDFAQYGHFAVARFVQNFAGLCILRRKYFCGLVGGEIIENAAGKLRIDPEVRERGEDAIAAEDRAEPRDARVRVWSIGRV